LNFFVWAIRVFMWSESSTMARSIDASTPWRRRTNRTYQYHPIDRPSSRTTDKYF
jgi:hypothetical protein